MVRLTPGLDARLAECLEILDRDCGLRAAAPGLFEAIAGCLLAPGKRLRPGLMLLAYAGYARRARADIWKPAAALEMFHAFALIHDDIVDESPVRRGRPALHVALAGRPAGGREADMGRKLAMLAGDVLYSMAVRTFLSFEGEPRRTVTALELLMATAVRTGAGAFAEVLTRARPPEELTRRQILAIHGLKTAEYSVSCPLQVGAALGEAAPGELQLLGACGRLLGSAFQMQDDVDDLAAFCRGPAGDDRVALAETKLMVPMWWAWQEAAEGERGWLRELYRRGRAAREDLPVLEGILERTRALERTRQEAAAMVADADGLAGELAMRPEALAALRRYVEELLPGIARPAACSA